MPSDTGQDDSIASQPAPVDAPKNPSWQFSLRTLLVATAVVSVLMAIGVHFAGVMFALAFAVVVQAVMLLTGDWLIRPENRRALAFVTAGSWIVLGGALFVVGVREVYLRMGADGHWAALIFAWCLVGAGGCCYYIAAKRWRRLTGRQ